MIWSSSVPLMEESRTIVAWPEVAPMVASGDACYSGAMGGRVVFSSDDLTQGASTAPALAKALPR